MIKPNHTIWCLFDGSGIMGLPWAEAGYKVKCFNADDADHGPYSSIRIVHHNIDYINKWIDNTFIKEALFGSFGRPGLILAFPPCTDMAVSGAAHFARKRLVDPLFQESAVTTARVAHIIADQFNIPYMIENPVSVLSSFWRKPDCTFHPYEYGGYLEEGDINPFFPNYIKPRDAYPKKTCLWVGNGFIIPPKKPVMVAQGFSDQHNKLGGKSVKTKLIRSLTPRGLAKAVYLHNTLPAAPGGQDS